MVKPLHGNWQCVGWDVILVARSEEKLRLLATQLHQKYNVRTEVIVADLSQERAGMLVFEAVQQMQLPVDVLINNAGGGDYGLFETVALEQSHAQVMLNVATLVDLTRAFVPGMLERRQHEHYPKNLIMDGQPRPNM